jgi:hypothetical protein
MGGSPGQVDRCRMAPAMADTAAYATAPASTSVARCLVCGSAFPAIPSRRVAGVVLDDELQRPGLVLARLAGRQGQGHVDPGRDAAGSDDLALDHHALGDRLSAEVAQVVANGPVAGRALALQDSGGAEQHRPRTDRGRPPRRLVCAAHPLHRRGVLQERHLPEPGMTMMSGDGTSSSEEPAVRTSPTSACFGPGVERRT